MKCANRECAVPLAAANRSSDNTAYCAECGDFVWAFRPNSEKPAEWFSLNSDADAATHLPLDGVVVEGDQCEGCGLNSYRVVKDGKWSWVAVCDGQEWDGTHHEGCGLRHPVRQKMRCEVIF